MNETNKMIPGRYNLSLNDEQGKKTALTIPSITIPCKVIAYLKASFHTNLT